MKTEALPKLKNTNLDQNCWRPWQFLLFRWTFIYLMLYSFNSFLEVLKVAGFLRELQLNFEHFVAHEFARQFLNVQITSFPNYSDHTYNYILCLCFALLATAGTVIWSLLDRKSRNHNKLMSWFRLVMQIHVGATVLSYGMAKVVPCQFPQLGPIELTKSIGDHEQSGLLWAAMGCSQPYTIFGGVTELIAGFLLMLPATALIGALLTFAVMINVFMFNIGFNIGVKVLCFHLLFSTAVLFLPDLRGLLKSFFLQKPFYPVSYEPLFEREWLNTLVLVLQVFCCLFWTGDQVHTMLNRYASMHSIKHYAQDGIWIVEDQKIDGKEVSNADDENLRWGRLSFENRNLAIQNTVGNRIEYSIDPDQPVFPLSREKEIVSQLKFRSAEDASFATVQGSFRNKRIWCLLRAVPEEELPLNAQISHQK